MNRHQRRTKAAIERKPGKENSCPQRGSSKIARTTTLRSGRGRASVK